MFNNVSRNVLGTLTEDQVARYLALVGSDPKQRASVSYRCTKCSCIRPERAHHCSVCKRCICRMVFFNMFFYNYNNLFFKGSSLSLGK